MNVHGAKTNLAQLIQAAEAGEDVFITTHGERVAQLVAIELRKPKFGTSEGIVSPVDESVLFAMNENEARDFLEGRW